MTRKSAGPAEPAVDRNTPYEYAPQEHEDPALQALPGQRPGEIVFELDPKAVDLSGASDLGMAEPVVEMLAMLRRRHGLLRVEPLWPVDVEILPAEPPKARAALSPDVRELLSFLKTGAPRQRRRDVPPPPDPKLADEAKLRVRIQFDPRRDPGSIARLAGAAAGIRCAEPLPYRWLPLLNEHCAHGLNARSKAPAEQRKLKLHWGQMQLKRPAEWDGFTESNIAVLDSGCDARHPAMEQSVFYLPGDKRSRTDTSGHGTFVAGIIAARWMKATTPAYYDVQPGVLPNARVLMVNIMEETTVGETVLHAVDPGAYSLALRKIANMSEIRVVNLSIGSESYSKVEAADIALLEDRGVTVVASCGNALLDPGSRTAAMYPALLPTVLSVGALAAPDFENWKQWDPLPIWPGTRRKLPASAAKLGRKSAVDVFAPGQWILSSAPMKVRRDPDLVCSTWLSGTSMAAPHVAAAAAVLAARGLAPAEIRAKLRGAMVRDNLVCDWY